MAESPPFRGNSYRHSVALNRWIARARKEQALEPDLPIIDPHHHLWVRPVGAPQAAAVHGFTKVTDMTPRYLLDELLADINSGHNVLGTVFVQCGASANRVRSELSAR